MRLTSGHSPRLFCHSTAVHAAPLMPSTALLIASTANSERVRRGVPARKPGVRVIVTSKIVVVKARRPCDPGGAGQVRVVLH